MDESDVELLGLLSANPRAPYRELADHLHVSVQAVHRRIQNLQDRNVITGFTANISMGYLGALRAHFVGHSTCESMQDMVERLRAGDSVITTLVSSGNMVHVNGLLRNVESLELFTEFAKRAASIPEGRVAIETPDPRYARRAGQAYTPLSSLDVRIIRALHQDARKSAADTAAELGVSAVTVRRRLDRMVRERSIEFAADVDPTFSGDIASLLSVTLRGNEDRGQVGRRLVEKHRPSAFYFLTFLNLPDFLVIAAWSKTVAQLKAMVDAVAQDPSVKNVVCNVALAGFKFRTWRDALVEAGRAMPIPGA